MISTLPFVSLTVSDLSAAIDFYERVLSFEHEASYSLAATQTKRLTGITGSTMQAASLTLQDYVIVLREFPQHKGRRFRPDTRSHDLWVQSLTLTTDSMDSAYRRLRLHKVDHISTAPQPLPAQQGVRAFCFSDPDGHHLEVTGYAGATRSTPTNAAPFTGISRTSIVVRDTATSLRFYRDLLGLTQIDQHEQYGIYQDYLSMVSGSHMLVTVLQASAASMGLALLDYRKPTSGRALLDAARPNDLCYVETTFVTDDLDALAARLHRSDIANRASEVMQVNQRRLLLVRDPDGHPICITQATADES
jgi:catechol 2,3-dioxygenase-like lactoylglutathione lyase family enzyme